MTQPKPTTCQYGSCCEDVGESGITVSLKTATEYNEQRADFCSAAHAAAALMQLAVGAPIPRAWSFP